MTSRATLPGYLIGTAASFFGNAAIAVVLPWLVLERTGSPAVAGLVAALSALPGPPAALFGGYLIDRVGRRRMAVLSDVGSALAVAALAVVDAFVGLDVGWFVTLGVCGALFDVPGMTAREALLADVAEASGIDLDRVGALRGAVLGLSTLAGPALAGWLLTVLPAVTVVWLTAACSALAALATAVVPLPRATSAEHHDTSPLAGLRHAWRNPGVLRLLLVHFGLGAVSAPLVSVVLPSSFNATGQPGLLGLTLSTYAVGTVVGSALYGTVFVGHRWGAWVTLHTLVAGGAALIATLAGFWPVAAGMLGLGVAGGLLGPVTSVCLTVRTPDGVRGRVLALFSASVTVAGPVGLGTVTAVLAVGPLSWGAWTVAAGCAVIVVGAVTSPRLRHYISSEEAADADHQATR